MVCWISSDKFPGVRWRQHPNRTHGVQPDRYFTLRFQAGGERREEALGWATEGWTEKRAALELEKLKAAARVGEGPCRLTEKRRIAAEKRREEEVREQEAKRQAVTFGEFFEADYAPQAVTDKSAASCKAEASLYRRWIGPHLGSKPLGHISPLDIERLKKAMLDAGRKPRSVVYCLAVIRQVFNLARSRGVFAGNSPTMQVRKPKADNRRLRFLSHDEAARLLSALARRSQELHDMAMLSLHTGMRAGEIFSLEWGDVDFTHGHLTLRDTKGGRNRSAIMTEAVAAMLRSRPRGGHHDLVFAGRSGNARGQVSKSFDKAVAELGLNADIEDSRQKVCFHTLRHTFASWLVQNGTPLYTVKELMGHASLAMTERYAHLAPNLLRAAVRQLEEGMNREEAQEGRLRKVN